jgi:peptidyl-prolyl cis-trans isomerase B (cyclophilin B)
VYKDSQIPNDSAGGYSVIGQVTEGMATLRRIADGGAESDRGDGRPNLTVAFNSVLVDAG